MITTAYFGPNAVPEANRYVGDFASRIIWGEEGRFPPYCSMGVFRDNDLIGAAIYTNWDRDSGVIELSLASKESRWLSRPVMQAMFHLPFNELGCQMVVTRTSEHNKTALRMNRAFGFTDHVIPRLRGRDEAEHIMTLTDDDWRKSRFYIEKDS